MGEIDILAQDKKQLVVVEVRARRGKSFPPSWNLHPTKQRRLKIMAKTIAQKYRRAVRIELWEIRADAVRSFRVD